MPFFRPTFCEIDLSALRHNFRELKRFAKGHEIMGMVKANAYGHGVIAVSRALVGEGASRLAVASIEEGIELRRGGLSVPILCLGGPLGATSPDFLEYGLTPVIFNEEGVDLLVSSNAEGDKPLEVHLKVDTGMGRLGVRVEALPALLKRIREAPHLKLTGVMTHLARADETEGGPTQEQWDLFHRVQETVRQAGFKTPVFHAANSAALLDGHWEETAIARPGIALYGAYPHPRFQEKVELRPVMRWKSEIISLKEVPVGSPISYGGTFVTQVPSRIAVVAVGYADGFSRLFSNRGEVLIRGRRAPVVGRVCMDLTMVDVTKIEGASLGDEVVLIGAQGHETLRAEELAEKIGTISYEVFCGVSARVPRITLSGAEGSET